MTVARYSLPSPVGISVMSPTQLQFGAGAVKSRRTRSGNGDFDLSGFVNPLRRLMTRATRPRRRIESATDFSETTHPKRVAPAGWILDGGSTHKEGWH